MTGLNRFWGGAGMALFAMIATIGLCEAQGAEQQPDMSLTPEVRKEVIEGALQRLDASYVFPEVAKKMSEAIHKRMASKEYDGITSAKGLAETLTTHLREVCHDKHLRILYHYEARPPHQDGASPTAAEREQQRRDLAAVNYGFEKVERLAGNIGYLDFRFFGPPEFCGDTAAAAMNFLAGTDAMIIDLRHNGGGDPSMVQLICSYLFGPEPVHLNDLYFRPDNSTQQFWTLPYVPGKRYEGKEVYVLTSQRTFSGAEECTYNLKNLKRATIVGETTGGGANPGGPQDINTHFAVWVPVGRAINPITKTNWEGTGVKPDVDVPADLALKTAHLMALKKLETQTKDPHAKDQLKEAIETAQQELDAAKK